MKNITRDQFYQCVKSTDDNHSTITSATLYYMNVYDKHPHGGFFAKWNWAAFFFGPLWMVYRRMYLYTFILIMLGGVGLKVNFLSLNLDFLGGYRWLPEGLILGFLGNALYMNFVKNKILRHQSLKGPLPIRSFFLVVGVLFLLIASSFILTIGALYFLAIMLAVVLVLPLIASIGYIIAAATISVLILASLAFLTLMAPLPNGTQMLHLSEKYKHVIEVAPPTEKLKNKLESSRS